MKYLEGVERSIRAHSVVVHTWVIPSEHTGSLLGEALKKIVPQKLTTPIKDTLPSSFKLTLKIEFYVLL